MSTLQIVYGEERVVHSTEEVARALIENRGLLSQTAKSLDLSYQALRMRINRNKRLQDTLAIAREGILDLAEGKLVELLEAGDGVSVRFVLATLGKDRGYTDKHEIEHTGAVDVNITEIAVERPNVVDVEARELPPGDDPADT